MSEEKRIGNDEAAWPANGLDTSDVRRMALALQGEQCTGLSDSLAVGHGFVRDIDHVGAALGIEMSEHNEYSWASRGILPPMPG